MSINSVLSILIDEMIFTFFLGTSIIFIRIDTASIIINAEI